MCRWSNVSVCVDSQDGCSMVAWDRQDGDLSDRIQIMAATTCAATQNVACYTCPVAELQQGLCVPNR